MDPAEYDRILFEYYNRRASTYDRAYDFKRFQEWEEPALEVVAASQAAMRGRRVLEIACGTGFWTHFLADATEHITATDYTPNMLAIARSKQRSDEPVQFMIADAFNLTSMCGQFNAAFHMRWFSHVPRERIAEFLNGLHQCVGHGARVFMGDDATNLR